MNVDVEELISKVYEKSEIWDTRLKLHANRVVTNRCWKEIAKDMGVNETAIRKKWKYLRDQFSVEFGKMNSNHLGNPGRVICKPKWPYFKLLYFLKDIVRPRASSRRLSTPRTKKTAEINTSDSEVGENTEDNFVTDHELEDEEDEHHVNDEQRCNEVNRHELDISKRTRLGTKYNDSIIDVEKRKVESLEQVLENHYLFQEENYDLLFFKSLLPHVSKIPENMKLRFRNQIQQVVDEFAYTNTTIPKFC